MKIDEDIKKEDIKKEDLTISVNYEDLMKSIATILLRNSDNKMTVENLNGIMSSIRQDVSKLGN